MYKILISFALLTSSLSYAGFIEVDLEISQKIQMYDKLREQEETLYGKWFLDGVITGLENALLVLRMDYFSDNAVVHQESVLYPD